MASEELQWCIGLMNAAGRYLTAEQFGYKINASATTLRKKQKWILEQGEENVVFLKSHLGKYLSCDKKGVVSCSTETRGADQQFCVTYCKKANGRWVFKSRQTGLCFGGSEDKLSCTEKEASEKESWSVQLALHPQAHLKNINRKRFAKLDEESILCTETIPWGSDCLITFEWHDGNYALKSTDERYLHRDGSLVESLSNEVMFALEVRSSGGYSGLAFKDCEGKFLTAVGKGTMLARNTTISKDELFVLKQSHPQGYFTHWNGKNVSIRQGMSLSANQDRTEEEETHQVEYDKPSSGWKFRAFNGKFWSAVSAGIEATGTEKTTNANLFDFEYVHDGFIALKCRMNDKYVSAKRTGSLSVSADKITDTEKFIFTVINRPMIIFRTDFGFMGCKTQMNSRIECNKASHETLHLESGKNGEYFIKGGLKERRYWTVASDKSINADGLEPYPFFFEFASQSKMYIRNADNSYIKCEQNGTVCLKATKQTATQIEY